MSELGYFKRETRLSLLLAQTELKIKAAKAILACLSNGCAGSLPVLLVCALAAALAKRCLILLQLPGSGNGAVFL